MSDNTNSVNHKDEFYKKKNKAEMKHQVLTFVMMIAFTIVSFGLVMSDVSKLFTTLTILLLAGVQVMFQLFYFMHLKEEEHEFPTIMIFAGIFAATLCILGLTTIVWWG
ncbi:cytochrome c oxidase subunit IVB [Bacillaceae bacterium W0354]